MLTSAEPSRATLTPPAPTRRAPSTAAASTVSMEMASSATLRPVSVQKNSEECKNVDVFKKQTEQVMKSVKW